MVFFHAMALTQQKFRETVFQALFSSDFFEGEEGDLVAMLMKNSQVSRKNAFEALAKAKEVHHQKEDFDKLIASVSKEFPLERIARAERNVLRLALYEMKSGLVPHKVAISEGVRLGRKYATKEASKFVNAILDTLYKEMDGAGEE
jgi:N utilization substance protein B